MARQGWGVSIATAIGVAAGAGAAQLGFGYGLGVITWTPTDAGATDTAWADGLAWATWLAASSTVLGAVCAQRLHQRTAPTTAEPQVTAPATVPEQATPAGEASPAVDTSDPQAGQVTAPDDRGGLLRRVTLALGAGIGGLVTVLLIAVPARVATGADTGAPQRTAAVQATLGILLGVLVAIWALRSRAAAVNVTATAAWLWLLAVVSVIDGVRVGRGLTGAQLGTWQLDPDHSRYWIGDQIYWPGALLALVPALLIGLLAARRAARQAGHRVGAAASGAAGPVLVALAYLTTLPHWSTLGPAQLSTQLIAPYAVIAGVGGSVLAAVLAERAERHRAAHRSVDSPATTTDPTSTVAPELTPAAAGGPTPTARATTTPVAEADSAAPAPDSSARGAGRRSRADATPQATGAGAPPNEGATPRVPAPRTNPDVPVVAPPTTDDPTSSARRTRATRRATRPATD
ncbi:hypothetical protein LADH09A_001422 [Micromonospora sp. LAH09]|uniref:hypothetical protein n=1 Tax=Micromonospora cabrerizensis TaxID=2911213 RepID=UPI001EE782B8|nr:hypothetical protein [Micromonospora cabrerizensis]MCG5467657.1 hypothetical protein [Micromonospora cabrerizensis]